MAINANPIINRSARRTGGKGRVLLGSKARKKV
jgi:hypothetical protein